MNRATLQKAHRRTCEISGAGAAGCFAKFSEFQGTIRESKSDPQVARASILKTRGPIRHPPGLPGRGCQHIPQNPRNLNFLALAGLVLESCDQIAPLLKYPTRLLNALFYSSHFLADSESWSQCNGTLRGHHLQLQLPVQHLPRLSSAACAATLGHFSCPVFAEASSRLDYLHEE